MVLGWAMEMIAEMMECVRSSPMEVRNDFLVWNPNNMLRIS